MKNTYRFFVAPGVLDAEQIMIEDRDLLHQWSSVLRLRPGQQVELLDGSGQAALVELDALDRRQASGRVLSRGPVTSEPRLQITLFVALARGERFEWVLQKGTELGASAFVPLRTAHTVSDSVSASKIERWQRIIREAAEQSGRGRLPALAEPQTLAQSLHAAPPGILLAETQASLDFKRACQTIQPERCGIWSGPEGGWSSDELSAAAAAGLQLAGLGPRILRAETAPIAALAALCYEHNEWLVLP